MTTSRTATTASALAAAASGALATVSAKLAGEPEPNVVAPLVTASAGERYAAVPKAEADLLRRAYRAAERRAEKARQALDAAKADILARMGGHDVLVVAETGKPLAEHKPVESLIFDQVRFRAEHPDESAGYMKPRVQRRFRVLT